MKQRMLKAMLSVALVATLLLTTVLPVWAAEKSFEIFAGENLVDLSLYEWATLVYSDPGEGVTVSWMADTEGVVELDEESNMVRAVGIGSTVVVATTSDGRTDRARINVREPLAWNGCGTYTLLLNGQYASAVASFTVPENGIYEITSDAPYVLYGEILTAEGDPMAYDPMDSYDTGLFVVDRLQAGQTYYAYIYSSDLPFEGGQTLSVTLKKSTTYTKDGIYFLDDTIRGASGDILMPRYVTIPYAADSEVTFSLTKNENNAVQAGAPYVNAQNVGTATVQANYRGTTDAGVAFDYADTVNVTVEDYRWLHQGTNSVTGTDRNAAYQAFAFYAETNDEFAFRCKGGEFVYAELYDDAGLADYVDTMPIGNFYVDTDMNAGEVVLLYVAYSKYQSALDILVGPAAKPTSMTLSIPDVFAVEKNGDNYLLYEQSALFLNCDFGAADGAMGTDVTYSFSDPSIVAETDTPGLYEVVGIGTFTVTAKTATNLTDTITVNVIEYKVGDLNRDASTDMLDAMAAFRHSSGAAGLTGHSLAIADLNGDAVVDMLDTFTIYATASGNPPAGPDLSIESDNPPTVDPTPGDQIEDGNW